ncbi:MAG TPA: tRNA (N(6)-L-threonylcarbamoyladenosine(37)-C(2))-methylthiotransferase MtaB [Chloroflexia bacterium]|nr:tRNA (N(6)-L-threonylcarbamoyladenosine(37)-C(2))-methylthiotransferase MtaB [Chloroflexia bacterium]
MSNLIFLDTWPRTQPPQQDNTSPRVAFVTLGCKVNQSDTQKAIADFRAAGFRIVPPSAPAEVYVVNTCSVTHVADRKSRQWLRRSARANPDALVVATGCYAESGRETLQEMAEVGLVIGYKQKDDLLGLVLERMPGYLPPPAVEVEPEPERTPSWAGGEEEGELDPEFRARTRAMVKIEDGCNDFCTFCIIPFTRGMPRSTPTNEVVSLVRQRLSEGFKEIVLTGVHMGKYGQDHAQRKRSGSDPTEARDLPGVVKAVLDRTDVPRLRITSVEPTDAVMMLPLLSDPRYAGRLAPHLHLPLQSGCDETLARMKRDYTTGEYAAVVRQCREAVPGISITTDLITGFPGETDVEWAATCEFVRAMEFARVHVFPYSQRPGTPALSMPGQVSPEVRHARTLEMVELSARLEAAHAIRHLGTVRPVLWEMRSEDGTWHGLTDDYLRVHTRQPGDLQNSITPALLSAYDARGLWAEVR